MVRALDVVHPWSKVWKRFAEGEVHITIDEQSRSKYGGIRAIEVAPGVVRLNLEKDTARFLGTDEEMVIRFSESEPEGATLMSYLKALVSGTEVSLITP